MSQLWKELGREKRGNPTSPRSDQKMLKVTTAWQDLLIVIVYDVPSSQCERP